jgi:hypothetical protein
MHWEYAYYAMMFFVALPIAWFRRDAVAGIVFATWGIGQVAYQVGLPEPQTQAVLYGTAFALAMFYAVSAANIFTAVLFFPLAVTCVCQLIGLATDLQAWWAIFWLAMMQALSLPFVVDWARVYDEWRFRQSLKRDGEDMLRVAHA